MDRLPRDWPVRSGVLDLGFSHTHCTVSLTGEPGPGMTIAIHLIKETPSTSARGSLARFSVTSLSVRW